MTDRFNYEMKPTDAIARLNALDADLAAGTAAAAANAAAAGSAANAAAGSAAGAAAARDAAIAVWQASTAPAEQLAAISKSFHSGAIVDVFLYDTSRDSDGGAWRKRCRHTSWENEPLVPGIWMGQQANLAAATAAGGVAGSYYQSGVDGRFYQFTGPGAITETWRGNSREFPALALIVVEASRVVFYDATKPELPMWMSFSSAASNLFYGPSSLTCAAAYNGKVLVGDTGTGFPGLYVLDFVQDAPYKHAASGRSIYKGTIARRNAAADFIYNQPGGAIANDRVNDAALTVLPDAPVDQATGLPVPTVAVGTNGGMTVIKHDGTVVNSAYTGSCTGLSIAAGRLYYQRAGATWGFTSILLSALAANFVGPVDLANIGAPNLGNTGFPVATGKLVATRGAAQLTLTQENPAVPTKSMVAYLTNAFNTGWMVGDIRGAWLADTTAETIAGSSELVTNGSFNADLSGWTLQVAGTSTITWNGGTAQIAPDGTNGAHLIQAIATVPGRSYTVVFDLAGGSVIAAVGTTPGTNNAYNTNSALTTVGTKRSFTFVATSTTSYLDFTRTAAVVLTVDNVSVKLAVPDRSVKGNGLVVNGSLTKAAVAAGAQLVAYSGFSATNFLEQPYNSDLDFGTGDFSVMGWLNLPAAPSANQTLLWRQTPGGTGAGLSIMALTTGFLSAGILGIKSLNSTVSVVGLHHIVVKREAGVLSISIDGQPAGSVADTTSLTNATATLRVGLDASGSQPATTASVALWKMGGTAPSTDQIAQIYREELALFQPNSKCTFDGTSSNVTALAYDDTADLLHVGTSWGRSALKGLQRVESSATTVGAVTALAAVQGAHITGGATGGRYAQPALTMRDELRRREEARRAMALEFVPFDFDSIAAQTVFTLPVGYSAKGVFVAGAKKRVGATKDYTVSFDGYRETVNFGAPPGATWVQITANRRI
jgi:hypothetical protein